MIESSMYFGIGLLFGILIGLLLIPLAHARAVRLTARRLKAVVPELTAEVLADKDLLRAEFAMSTRRPSRSPSNCYWRRSPRKLSSSVRKTTSLTDSRAMSRESGDHASRPCRRL